MLEFLQNHLKELVAVLSPIIALLIGKIFKDKAELELGNLHNFIYIVDEPLRDQSGEIVRSKQSVEVCSYILTNSGKDTAKNIELVFNWKPLCMNILPARDSTEHIAPDNRYIRKFPSLAPRESLQIELLNVNNALPQLITARSDQCVAKKVDMWPQKIVELWVFRLRIVLLLLGLGAAVYLSIWFLQILIESGTA